MYQERLIRYRLIEGEHHLMCSKPIFGNLELHCVLPHNHCLGGQDECSPIPLSDEQFMEIVQAHRKAVEEDDAEVPAGNADPGPRSVFTSPSEAVVYESTDVTILGSAIRVIGANIYDLCAHEQDAEICRWPGGHVGDHLYAHPTIQQFQGAINAITHASFKQWDTHARGKGSAYRVDPRMYRLIAGRQYHLCCNAIGDDYHALCRMPEGHALTDWKECSPQDPTDAGFLNIAHMAKLVEERLRIKDITRPDYYGAGDHDLTALLFSVGRGDDYCRGRAMELLLRAGNAFDTTAADDLHKAQSYVERLIKHLESKP